MAKTSEKLTEFAKIGVTQGTPHSSANYTLSGGFGSVSTVTLTDCTDAAGRVRITSLGTGQGASPTVTIAYTDPLPDRAPHIYATRGGGSQATITMSATSEFTTGCVLTFNGTAATGGETYTFNYMMLA